MKKFSSILAVAFIVFFFVSPYNLSAQQTTGTLTIQQKSPNGMIGTWTLIKPENKRVSLRKETQTLSDLAPGQYTLLIDPPSGATTSILKFLENDLIETIHTPQISFEIESGMEVTLRINYVFTRVGVISVSSEPPGISYTMIGPNGYSDTGTTPTPYTNMPEGLYSVRFTALENCVTPPPLSDKLVKDSRINFAITISCEKLNNTEQQQKKDTLFEFVNTTINGETIIFTDTPQKEWFAPFVHTVLKTGIMSGYKDASGKLTGEFGPGNNVTLAELLKIAHQLGNVDTAKVQGKPSNTSAGGTWFEKLQKSAEDLNWLAYQNPDRDLLRPATRAEVVVTLLQVLEIPRLWPHGDLFSDVDRKTKYAAAIETAGLDELIAGYSDGTFRPNAPINRAEIAKIVSQAITLYLDR